ncbi:MAG TPA: 5'-methylthioadenosine/adenosylhomocysteine nucleosidase [Bacilli bacterium]
MRFRKIGLIGAMDEEIRLFHEHIAGERVTETAGGTYREGDMFGKRVVLCKSGVGKVNAAVCTLKLIDRFGVDAVIFTGVAGALDPRLSIGDIVISNDCMHHDMDASALGFAKGTIPFMPQSVFAADPQLVELAFAASERVEQGRSVVGRVLSGDQFIADRSMVQTLHRQMGGTCTEMEGAAVAQVCALSGIPFVIIRSMSDKADGSAQINFQEFAETAAARSCGIVREMLQALA